MSEPSGEAHAEREAGPEGQSISATQAEPASAPLLSWQVDRLRRGVQALLRTVKSPRPVIESLVES